MTQPSLVHVERLTVEGLKRFQHLDLELHRHFTVIVGDNETGKSSVLEALELVLKGRHGGRMIQYALDPYLFNADHVANYFSTLRSGGNMSPPRIVLEAYLAGEDLPEEVVRLVGTHNSRGEDCPGLKLTIDADPEYTFELAEYARDTANPAVLPVEYYRPVWRSFAGSRLSFRAVPFRTAVIDPLTPRGAKAPGRYLTEVVGDVLSESQRRELALQYKKLRHSFSQEAGVLEVNRHLAQQGGTGPSGTLSIQMDMSARATWEQGITAHLDELPYYCAGKGEQCLTQFRLAIAGAERAQVLLVEEPENHLSHSNLNALLNGIRSECSTRQVVIATHSAFVLNRMGLDNLVLVSEAGRTARLTELPEGTRDYFMKLPGFDTLRLILAARCILVEGPSDELVVQRAYLATHGKLPLEDRVDVISVGSLAFRRFLEIAQLLQLDVRVVTDNDGSPERVAEKYASFSATPSIRICYDSDPACRSLEDQILKANSRELLNELLSKSYSDEAALLVHMKANKTETALRLFEAEGWEIPAYIKEAIAE